MLFLQPNNYKDFWQNYLNTIYMDILIRSTQRICVTKHKSKYFQLYM